MQYAFSAGIRILDTAVYSSLTDAQRADARKLLFEKIQPIVDAMGVFETETPLVFLEARLAEMAGAEWGPGPALEEGTWYYIDPETGEVVCVRDYILQKDSVEHFASVSVDGNSLKAGFFVKQTAVN